MDGEQIKLAMWEEILGRIQYLGDLKPESEQYGKVCDNVCKLYRTALENEKLDIEYNSSMDAETLKREQIEREEELKREQMEREEKMKKEQLDEQKKDRYIRLGLESAGIVLPLVFYGIWMRKGFKFEENGTFTSTTFRGLFNKFKPTKK